MLLGLFSLQLSIFSFFCTFSILIIIYSGDFLFWLSICGVLYASSTWLASSFSSKGNVIYNFVKIFIFFFWTVSSPSSIPIFLWFKILWCPRFARCFVPVFFRYNNFHWLWYPYFPFLVSPVPENLSLFSLLYSAGTDCFGQSCLSS